MGRQRLSKETQSSIKRMEWMASNKGILAKGRQSGPIQEARRKIKKHIVEFKKTMAKEEERERQGIRMIKRANQRR